MDLLKDASGAMSSQADAREYPFHFHGTGAEYFRIWIVNICLSIVTLGIYSAWAKVRKMQYFYGNSRIAGGSFEFTAAPLNILKGRVLVFFLFVAYQLAAIFQPLLGLALTLVLIPLIPWIMIKAHSFNLRYSSYRGLYFHFDARYWEAFRVYILLTVAIPLSLGFAYPYVVWRRKQFFVDNARYGNSSFAFNGDLGHFYTVYVVGWLATSGIGIAIFVLITAATVIASLFGLDITDYLNLQDDLDKAWLATAGALLAIAFYVLFILLFFIVNTGIQALISNHVWQRTSVAAAVNFNLDLNLWKVVMIQTTNILAIIFSFGLLIPWASVRMVRYKTSRFTMAAEPSTLESFIASERHKVSATGTELGDALDFDLGL
jgi:uncharacterized membrane protein YjgN (DUF898 family)